MEIFDKFSDKNRTSNVFYLGYERFTLENLFLKIRGSGGEVEVGEGTEILSEEKKDI